VSGARVLVTGAAGMLGSQLLIDAPADVEAVGTDLRGAPEGGLPVAAAGGFLGLWLTGQAQNIYTQIGTIMLVGLAAKNGILIVEFINQLRDQGQDFDSAVLNGSVRRLRPIVMTGLTTVMGSVPLLVTSGAGSETRFVIGTVILFGVAVAALFTLIVVPLAYRLIARRTSSPDVQRKRLQQALDEVAKSGGPA